MPLLGLLVGGHAAALPLLRLAVVVAAAALNLLLLDLLLLDLLLHFHLALPGEIAAVPVASAPGAAGAHLNLALLLHLLLRLSLLAFLSRFLPSFAGRLPASGLRVRLFLVLTPSAVILRDRRSRRHARK